MYLIRLSQDTYETLFDSLPALIFVTDRKGTFQWVNRSFIEFFGITKESSTGKTYSDLFSSNPMEIPVEFQEIISSGDVRKGIVKSVRLPHSDEKILKLDYFPWTDEVGTINGIIGFGIDITEHQRVEQIKKDVYEQLEKNIEQFAILGDHLRNPLAVIIGLCDLLSDEKIAQKIIAQAHEIDAIINRIDNGWIESEKIREFMKKYYDVGIRETHELVARAIHEEYIANQCAAGMTAQTHPSMRPWSELPPYLKESNIRQAEDIGKKLQLIRCGIGLATDDKKPDFSFTGDEIELLARKEHERWMTEKFHKGWVYGALRSDHERVHDCLVPWDNLPESQKQKDRNAIIALPGILGKVHLKIIRF